MGSPLNHQRIWDALPSPCFWIVWPGPEIWFLWLLLSGFLPESAMVLEQDFLLQLVVANLLLCGLSPFLQESWEGCVRPVGCSHVPEKPLLLGEELGIVLSPWPGYTMTLCASTTEDFLLVSSPGVQSRADAAFSPSQYYEMSYGLNIEMHKQVSLGGLGALSSSLSPAPWPHFAIWDLQGCPHKQHGKLLPAVAQCLWGMCPLPCALCCCVPWPWLPPHTRLCSGFGFRVPYPVLLCQAESGGAGLVLAWLLSHL